MHCKSCEYPLEYLTVNRCPECGREFDPDNPWTYGPEVHPPVKPSALLLLIPAMIVASIFGGRFGRASVDLCMALITMFLFIGSIVFLVVLLIKIIFKRS